MVRSLFSFYLLFVDFFSLEAIVVSILYNGIKKWIPDAKDVELDGWVIADSWTGG